MTTSRRKGRPLL